MAQSFVITPVCFDDSSPAVKAALKSLTEAQVARF